MLRLTIKSPRSSQVPRQRSQSLKEPRCSPPQTKEMGLAEGRRVPGERGDRGAQASPRPTAEVRGAREPQPQTMEFSRLLRAPPPAPKPAGGSERTSARPRPRETPPIPIHRSGLLPRAVFFFWRQISVGYFPDVFGDPTGGARQECGDSRDVKVHCRAGAPPSRR